FSHSISYIFPCRVFHDGYRSHLHLHSFPTRRSSDLRLPYQPTRRSVGMDTGRSMVTSRDRRGPGAARSALPFPRRWTSSRSGPPDRKSTRLNSSHVKISYAVFCLKKKKINKRNSTYT